MPHHKLSALPSLSFMLPLFGRDVAGACRVLGLAPQLLPLVPCTGTSCCTDGFGHTSGPSWLGLVLLGKAGSLGHSAQAVVAAAAHMCDAPGQYEQKYTFSCAG